VSLNLQFYSLTSIYYGVYEDDVYDLRKDLASRDKLLKNKLCGEGQNIRSLKIQEMALQIRVIENLDIKSLVPTDLYF
jgi:hypothetical protein